MRLTDRAQYHAARVAGLLPARLLHTLAGGPPGAVDGSVLDDQLHLGLEYWNRRADPRPFDVAVRREQTRRTTAIMAGPAVPVRDVQDMTIDGPAGPLRARWYAPFGHGLDSPEPLLVWLHGGGFCLGDLDTADRPARMLCRHGDVHVLSIDYRRAPEHVFPAAAEDATGAVEWALSHAAQMGADPARVAVGGDSAGGNLAAVAAQQASGRGELAGQLLVYPPTDMVTRHPSQDRFADGYYLTDADTSWFLDHYAADADRSDPRMSPLLAADLSGLAPAMVVTAAFDVLRDSGESYAHALRAAGVPVVLRRVPRLIHGFMNTVGINRAAREATVGIATAFRTMLELAEPLGRATPGSTPSPRPTTPSR